MHKELNDTQTISTATITFPALSPSQVDKFDYFLRTILWEETLPDSKEHTPFEVHRLKARIPVTDGRLLLTQGVRNLYDTNESTSESKIGETAKLVLIGRGVDQSSLKESLLSTLEASAS